MSVVDRVWDLAKHARKEAEELRDVEVKNQLESELAEEAVLFLEKFANKMHGLAFSYDATLDGMHPVTGEVHDG